MVALTLKRNGHNVTVLEATPESLQQQAAGVSTAPELKQLFDQHDLSKRPFSLPCSGITTVDKHDRKINHIPLIRQMNSWDALYHRLRWNVDGL